MKNFIKQRLIEGLNDNDFKGKQLDMIQKSNPMKDDYHTGIRSIFDIKTAHEAWITDVDFDEHFTYPDFSQSDAKNHLKSGKVKVYSSYPIKQGVFVTPSKRMALDYSGGKEPYSKTVDVDDIAWVNADEGQYAKIK